MSVKEFDKNFGQPTSIDVEKNNFVNRVEISVLNHYSEKLEYEEYSRLFNNVCYHLGVDVHSFKRKNNLGQTTISHLKKLNNKDFIQTLRVLISIYKSYGRKEDEQNYITKCINDAIEKSRLDLGMKWADGVFYPTGDKLLDTELIDHSLSLLDSFPNEKTNLQIALENHNSKKLHGVVENCYVAMEGVSRKLLNNKKTLDNNREDLMRLLRFSMYWDKIFFHYLKFAHEYSRHAGDNRHELKAEEVEGFLYLTCLIIRATIRASQS